MRKDHAGQVNNVTTLECKVDFTSGLQLDLEVQELYLAACNVRAFYNIYQGCTKWESAFFYT